MKTKIIELRASTVSLREDGIMHIHIKSGAQMELTDAIKVIEAMGKLGNKKKFPVLIDCGEFASVDKEARRFSASKDANIYTLADAVAYHTLAHKFLADFYMNHNKPEIPTKVFEDNESAIAWLRTLKNNP
ncbi:MAG TPA: hypothetical protein VNZ49_12920 [Bacteroidia bacterium]|jgi:hypothetical protein|nr:hypothetical protein [Bacteroidia bacterium]